MHVIIGWKADIPVVVQVPGLHLALCGTQKKRRGVGVESNFCGFFATCLGFRCKES